MKYSSKSNFKTIACSDYDGERYIEKYMDIIRKGAQEKTWQLAPICPEEISGTTEGCNEIIFHISALEMARELLIDEYLVSYQLVNIKTDEGERILCLHICVSEEENSKPINIRLN